MPRISQKASVTLSLVLSILFFAALIAAAFILPSFTSDLIKANKALNNNNIDGVGRYFILALAYAALAVAAAADISLFVLLKNVRLEAVFTESSVSLIRFISWCCIGEGIIFLVLGRFFAFSFAVGFAALFLGLCLRVVKNVIEEAMAIKAENDYTV